MTLDLQGIRDHLLKKTFTSVILVHFYAKRCFEIVRALGYSAQENFEEAFNEAELKDRERNVALANDSAN
jgi:hypothetical protein